MPLTYALKRGTSPYNYVQSTKQQKKKPIFFFLTSTFSIINWKPVPPATNNKILRKRRRMLWWCWPPIRTKYRWKFIIFDLTRVACSTTFLVSSSLFFVFILTKHILEENQARKTVGRVMMMFFKRRKISKIEFYNQIFFFCCVCHYIPTDEKKRLNELKNAEKKLIIQATE